MIQSNYSMILTIINKGFSDVVMDAARSVGAKGGTIINARGTGSVEAAKFLGISIEPEKEIVLIITENAHRQEIMKAIYKEAGLFKDGNGFSISMPVDHILGTAFINPGERKED